MNKKLSYRVIQFGIHCQGPSFYELALECRHQTIHVNPCAVLKETKPTEILCNLDNKTIGRAKHVNYVYFCISVVS